MGSTKLIEYRVRKYKNVCNVGIVKIFSTFSYIFFFFAELLKK